jgi:hypothetical protein
MHECNAQTLILPPFGPKRWDLTLTNMVLYIISFFLLSKGVLHKLDYYWFTFFWQGGNEKIDWLNGV